MAWSIRPSRVSAKRSQFCDDYSKQISRSEGRLLYVNRSGRRDLCSDARHSKTEAWAGVDRTPVQPTPFHGIDGNLHCMLFRLDFAGVRVLSGPGVLRAFRECLLGSAMACRLPVEILPALDDGIATERITLDEPRAAAGASAAIMVVPEPPKGSRTISPRCKQSFSASWTIATALRACSRFVPKLVSAG